MEWVRYGNLKKWICVMMRVLVRYGSEQNETKEAIEESQVKNDWI